MKPENIIKVDNYNRKVKRTNNKTYKLFIQNF